jgi:hypothetical protein
MILFLNLTFLSFGVVFRLKRGSLFILSALLLLALLGAIGMFFYSMSERDRDIAVVAHEGASLKRIPLDKAREWISLKEGTSLRVSGSAKGYLLVKTGLGLEGWVGRGSLLLD